MELPTKVDSTAFDKKKTAYCAKFAVAHLSSFRPHFQEGQTLGQGPEVWRNVSEHCLVAGIFADILAEELGLPTDQRENVVKAALLHDWYKKHESIAQGEARKEGTLSMETLKEIEARDTKALKSLGVSEEIISLARANVPTSEDGPQSPSEQIMWYVDAMLSNTDPVPIKDRFDNLERGWDGQREDPERAERNIRFSELYKPKYNGKSLYEVQRSIGERISQEFSSKIKGYQGDSPQLPLYLRKRFIDRVTA